MFAFWQHARLLEQASCCGVRGDYYQYYFPFPVVRSSALSDIGGLPARNMWMHVLADLVIPVGLVLSSKKLRLITSIRRRETQQ